MVAQYYQEAFPAPLNQKLFIAARKDSQGGLASGVVDKGKGPVEKSVYKLPPGPQAREKKTFWF